MSGDGAEELVGAGCEVSVSVFVPPWNVGVAPRIFPAEDSIVTLCPSGDMFVKSIETLPAFALNDVGVVASWPSRVGFERGIVLAELADDEARRRCRVVRWSSSRRVLGVEEAVVLDELPQPASASSPTATATADEDGQWTTVLRSALRLGNHGTGSSSIGMVG